MSTNFGKWECVTQAPSWWMHDGYQCVILVTQKWDTTLYIDGSIELTPQSSEAHFQSWSSTSKSPLPPKIPWTGPEVCCSSWGFHQSLRGEQQETRQLWEPAFATSTAERRDCKRGGGGNYSSNMQYIVNTSKIHLTDISNGIHGTLSRYAYADITLVSLSHTAIVTALPPQKTV